MILAISIVVALLFAVLAPVVVVMARVHTPTKDTPIDRDHRNETALVIVDMQTDFVDGNGYESDQVRSVIDGINTMAATAKQENKQVIALRQVHQGLIANAVIKAVGKGLGAQSSTGLGLHADLDIEPDAVFIKARTDGFSNSEFEEWLERHNVGTLEIAGLDGCYCVNTTSIGALNRGFDVVLHEQLILTTNQHRWHKRRNAIVQRGASISDIASR